MANVGKRKAFSIGAEKYGVNAFSQNEIEHFECCDEDVISNGEESEEYIVELVNEKNNSIVDSSSDMEEEQDDPGTSINGDSSWVSYGVADLSHLTQKLKKHECSQSHLNSILEFHLLGKVDIRQQLDIAFRSNVKRHNEKVTKNRYVLTKIIDCILFCGAFELAFLGHDEREDSLNTGVFRGLINFSVELDSSLKDHLTSATVFKGTSKEIQNDLLDCMLTVCQNHIKNEISKASFVSVIADETTDVSSISQLVVAFRYVLSNGQPVERFWRFTNPPGHAAKSIAECIRGSLEKVVAKPEKLISQSYDGTNVMCGQHADVQAFIQCAYKNAR
ncbi:hypothetical protein AVEN_3784-1 [Araneus ventricosus]|uniref:DUF4371 domain-containing protein n=1 Tax=Araneus ventricosus TaxID=182803 RepID=A0A4Y2VGN1_ARAVE|nr:hypothetical protein AVEN_3784-1 [Araneus ventricosus]